MLTVLVTAADVPDRDGGQMAIEQTKTVLARLRLLWVDRGYSGWFEDWCRYNLQWVVDVVKRRRRGFEVLRKRWIVERTFAWLNRYRRLTKDFETHPQNSETMIYIAMIHLMVRRLTNTTS